MSTTLPEPTVGGPPANSMMRAAQLPGGRQPAIMPAATCTIAVSHVSLQLTLLMVQCAAACNEHCTCVRLAISTHSKPTSLKGMALAEAACLESMGLGNAICQQHPDQKCKWDMTMTV